MSNFKILQENQTAIKYTEIRNKVDALQEKQNCTKFLHKSNEYFRLEYAFMVYKILLGGD